MAAPENNELNTLIPPPVVLAIGGESIEITPILTRELVPMIEACRPIMAELATGDAMAALANHPAALLRAVAIGARLDEARLGAMPLDELLALASAVIEVNADFFVRRLSPAMSLAMERVAKALSVTNPDGSSSTSDSATPDSPA